VSDIPPLGARLEFTRNNKTGTVHVMPHGLESWPSGFRGMNVAADAEKYVNALVMPRMLCGARAWPSHTRSDLGMVVTDFSDDDLCARCVRALGDQSWRAFHADNRADATF
jgi:hypothetical protein